MSRPSLTWPGPRLGRPGAHTVSFREVRERADMPGTWMASGVKESMLPALAAEAADQWTANFNPREAGQAEMETIYRAAF